MRQDPGGLRPAELTKWPDRCFGFRTVEEALHLGKRVLARLGLASATTSEVVVAKP